MAERVRVDPIDLHMSSAHMDMHHAELSAAHIAAKGAIEKAQVGRAGTSAAALQAKFADWHAPPRSSPVTSPPTVPPSKVLPRATSRPMPTVQGSSTARCNGTDARRHPAVGRHGDLRRLDGARQARRQREEVRAGLGKLPFIAMW
jgi:hypothetical protein